MKKIFLLFLFVFSITAINAQNNKNKKYLKSINSEAKSISKFKKQEAYKKLMRDSVIYTLKFEDSLRLAKDSITDFITDSLSIAYLENGFREIQLQTVEGYSAINNNIDTYYADEKAQSNIATVFKLSNYNSSHVKYINTSFTERAKKILHDGDANLKSEELTALNTERRAKLKAILGRSKERKLERKRKAYIKKYGEDDVTAWMNIANNTSKK